MKLVKPIVLYGPNNRPLPRPRGPSRGLAASYDAARTTTDNTNHWALANSLSADALNASGTRKTLRNRARLEVRNSPILQGIVLTLAHDTIGVGPTLQCLSENATANQQVERLFTAWARGVRLGAKLRTMRQAKIVDGEAFAMFTTNGLLRSAVKLDLRLIEAEQVSTPALRLLNDSVDGLVLDEAGNVIAYHVTKKHPGDSSFGNFLESDTISVERMIHLFRQDRAGQHRGVPEIVSCLSLWAQTRRYSDAVLAAAEAAADQAVVLESDLPPLEDDLVSGEDFETFEFEKRMVTVLPQGHKISGFKPEQPNVSHAEYMRGKINEGARPLSVPYNIAACDSSGYNYASGRLDHQTYDMSLDVERGDIEIVALDPIFAAWLAEAALIEGYLPQSFRMQDLPQHEWHWRNRQHVDPVKEAMAAEKELAFGGTTLAEHYARRGKDWEVELRQNIKERVLARQLEAELMRKAGLSPESAAQSEPESGSKPGAESEPKPGAKSEPKPKSQKQEAPA